MTWSPTVGTPYLPRRPLEAFVAGDVIDVPILVGTTANETGECAMRRLVGGRCVLRHAAPRAVFVPYAVIFVYEAINFAMTKDLYELVGAVLVGAEVFNESHALYPYPDPLPTDFRLFASTLLTDGLFVCATRNASEAMAKAQPARVSPTYAFQYSHLLSWGSGGE